ncbi:hypothetical protein C7447_104192 [Tenacibaculum adriaticum]|uniref:Uncharacterized protein n=1 Tax=Tenacibaculum adriaticum TaxID=413713 RepID=A0A5S5DNI0_9FLAO|nr:cupin domain-containing protein [Tenacibaculum adriaticum]TYP97503.1 hypothetical protein C7447_104192 [Tenacibaculum adriaticum]
MNYLITKIIKSVLISLLFVLTACKSTQTLPDPLAAGWKGKKVCETLSENNKLRTLKCTFPPGVGHEKHFHAEHFGYTLKGGKFRITDVSGTREVNVPTGYDFYNKKIEWHEVLNIGDSTAVFLIIEPKK